MQLNNALYAMSITFIRSSSVGHLIMDTKSLNVFIDLAENLHFSRTSDRHNMSPSTLSRLIQRLEIESGCLLFERSNRSVSLTPAGRRYLDFARKTLSAWQDLQHVNEAQQNQPHGTVSLYCSVTASHSVLNTILSDLRHRQPHIEIKLHTGDQALSLNRLQQGQEDFVIAARPDRLDHQIAFKVLSRSDLVFIAPKAACQVRNQLAAATKNNDWSNVPWVLAESGLSRGRLDQWFRAQNVNPRIYAQVSGHEAIVSMVALGCGAALVPKLVLTSSPVFDSIEVLTGVSLNQVSIDAQIEIGMCVMKRRINEILINAAWTGIVAMDN